MVNGIDDVLAQGQVIKDKRFISLTGQLIKFQGNNVSLEINDAENFVAITSNGISFMVLKGHIGADIPEFIDNAAALAGGVPSGCFYFTRQGTDRIVKQAAD